MSIKTMSTLPFRTTKVKVYFLGIISLSIYIPHKNIFNLYVSYFPDMYFLYHIFSNSLNKISKMCWVFTFKIKVRDKVFLIPCQSKQCQPCHSGPPKSRNISNYHIISYFFPQVSAISGGDDKLPSSVLYHCCTEGDFEKCHGKINSSPLFFIIVIFI